MDNPAKFSYSVVADKGIQLSLTKLEKSKIPFGKPKERIVPFEHWFYICDQSVSTLISKISDAANAEDDTSTTIIEGGVVLGHGFIAALSASELAALQLPVQTKLTLEFKTNSIVRRDDFSIKANWIKPSGKSALVNVNGCILNYEGKDYIIPEPLYSILNLIKSADYSSASNRYDLVAQIKDTLGDDNGQNTDLESFLSGLKVSYAAGFSLDIAENNNLVDFHPILFGRKKIAKQSEENQLDSDEDNLLGKELQEEFAREFRKSNGEKKSYLLSDGRILYFDPSIQKPLKVVRDAQRLPSSQKREFVSNPRKYMAEAIGLDEFEAETLETIFVETKQYSDRVLGIDIWRKPVVPWIKPEKNGWLPEKLGICIGDAPNQKMVDIAPRDIPQIVEKLDYAVRENHSSFIYDNVEFPNTTQTKEAIETLRSFIPDQNGKFNEDKIKKEVAGKYFLQVKDNIEELEFKQISEIDVEKIESPAFPEAIRNPPKSHQIKGFEWLAKNWLHKVPGALLADDMGLGKTFQIICFLYWLKQQQSIDTPFLIIAPSGLIDNWKQEIELHLPVEGLGKVVTASGRNLSALKRQKSTDISSGTSNLMVEGFENASVVLTTYETMRDYHLSFAQVEFAAIIYDEAQKLKNPTSQITRAAKSLKAKMQIAMTGTPVENRLQDLWSIYDVIYPGFLGSSKSFETNYNSGEIADLRKLNETLTNENQGKPQNMIRRMKSECMDSMPKKLFKTIEIEMPPLQANQYLKALQKAQFAKENADNRGYMLEVLQELRSVSLHPFSPVGYNQKENYFDVSARLKGLFSTLNEIKNKNEKALIFCESLEMQAILSQEIKKKYNLPFDVDKINGSIPSQTRQLFVNRFQNRGNGFDVMILSPKAGGVGLTLTAANHVIHLSRWWNPAVEDQSTDRAYRIGQTKDVTVYIPQALHPDANIKPTSFDLKLAKLMDRKRKLSQDFLLPDADEKDAEILLDDVLGFGVETTDEEIVQNSILPVPEQAKVEFETPQRKRLSVNISEEKKRQIYENLEKVVKFKSTQDKSDTTSAKPEINAPTHIDLRSGQRRDLTILYAHLMGEKIEEMEIQDRYMMSTPALRRNIINLMEHLGRRNIRIDRLILRYWDIASQAYAARETDDAQLNDIKNKIQYISNSTELICNRHSKQDGEDFHDRKIIVRFKNGTRRVWMLGRGISALFNEDLQCTVFTYEERVSESLFSDG